MTAALRLDLISVEDYLAGELVSPVKHEYLGGMVYAMAGTRNVHSLIASNVIVALGSRLKNGPCRPYTSDTKLRIVFPTHVRFYYPDVSVICRPRPPRDSFQDAPVVVVEVLSASTRRIDQGEKRDAYLSIASLAVYLLVEQDSAVVTAYRRTEQDFIREVYSDLNDVIPLPELSAELPLAEVYDSVEFSPEPVEED